MTTIRLQSLAPLAVLALSACGGGGSGARVNSTPTPVTSPPSQGSTGNITIFTAPVAGEYAVVGASIAGGGGNLDTYPNANDSFGSVASDQNLQPRIRYTSGGQYEVEMPGSAWDRLVPYKGIVNPSPDNNYFQPASVAQNFGYVVTSNSRTRGYQYSELAGWGSAAADRWGFMAFGTPTAQAAMPRTGSATFSGEVQGISDILVQDNLFGGFAPVVVQGSVDLNFDFAGGTLGGAMTLSLNDYASLIPLGTFTFKDTVFSVGSTTYSGRFVTNAAGDNFFLGRFTGPNAQETIGAWALPFEFTTGSPSLPADNQTHQAFGAWIARRGQ